MSLSNTIIFRYRKNFKKYNAILARYFLYSFGLIDSLFLPKLIDQGLYGEYEYYKNAIFLFPNLMLGAYTGYMYIKYSKGYDFYISLFKIGFLLSFIFGVIICLILRNFYLLVPLILINLYVIIEQGLKVRKKYIEIFLFKPLLSIIILIFGLISFYYYRIDIDSSLLILMVFSIAFLVWLPFVRSVVPNQIFSRITKFQIRKYYYLVNKIFTGTLASFVFGLLIFLERFIIEKYYSAFLAEYSFVFNMSQIMVIILSVFSYISSVEFGEKINSLDKTFLIKDFKKSLSYFLIFYGVYLIGIFGISFLYPEFSNVLWMTALLAISKGFFFFVGIYSPIAVYKHFNTNMLITVSIIFGLNIGIGHLIALNGGSLLLLLVVDALLIILYSIYILDIVFRRVDYSSIT